MSITKAAKIRDIRNLFYKKIAFFYRWIIVEKTSVPMVLFAASFSALILYQLFFVFSKIIWSKNLKVDFNTLSPLIRVVVASPGQRDGIETYVLYALVFACILLTVFFVRLYNYLKIVQKKSLLFFFSFLFFVSACFYYLTIGFTPPMSNRASGLTSFVLIVVVMSALWLLRKLASRREKWADFLVIVSLLPICFIAVAKISIFDYSFIFSPALRILNHVDLKDIYFQYDMLLSLIAALWMKLGMDLNLFQVVGQFSFYVLFLASFFFSKKFFIRKQLAYYLLFVLVLVKVYALMHDPVLVFQVTPLRLDWWILVFILAFMNGMYNRLLGIVLGLLIIFHRTFGLIYTIGYFEILFALLLFDFVGSKISVESLNAKIKKHFLISLPNIVIVACSFVVGFAITGGNSMEAASDYQKIGIGFMPISTVSFYWYLPVLISAAVVLLIKKRKELSANYFNASLLLVAFSIGNSIYFFGRSHEHNIINISASLIFVLFIFFDLVIDDAKDKMRVAWVKTISVLLPASFILLVTFFYSGVISDKINTQFNNALRWQTVYPYPLKDLWSISKIKKLTNNSKKVYFTGTDDFYYYYYGSYTPNGYFSPYASWIYKKDMVNFMQNLLNNGYYIVFPEVELGVPKDPKLDDNEISSALTYNSSVIKYGFKVVWNGE